LLGGAVILGNKVHKATPFFKEVSEAWL